MNYEEIHQINDELEELRSQIVERKEAITELAVRFVAAHGYEWTSREGQLLYDYARQGGNYVKVREHIDRLEAIG